ncbi:anhydro-N-acetylmuramic acid kinase [Sneathiella sp.]|jgi:anhydro-N-acetylmuramic acid kinase|uniref:anhydro-N-acetylmuramic acid kinase n=1 Tax=Sneathiella sp. TaxID=1964365 RepID=UPI0039E471F6
MTNRQEEAIWAVGLMSGTSMDGVDAAMIRTDGHTVFEVGPTQSVSYEPDFAQQFKRWLGKKNAPDSIVDHFTRLNAEAVDAVVKKSGIQASDIGVVGFHGQTLFHDAPNGITVQVGNGQLLADLTGINVVTDFRTNDVKSGGEGAPFAPLYHRALAADLTLPVMVLNLGGVANVSYVGTDILLAFDTGPASALIDDWVQLKGGGLFDEDGKIAARGTVDQIALAGLMDNPYFDKPAPKSLDRNDFSMTLIESLSIEDGAATLTEFTVQTIAKALDHCPTAPNRWLVTGGGRKNKTMMDGIARLVGAAVEPVETVGWNGDELEAEAFAFLAVRSLRGLPLSLPTTTGVPTPTTGGRLFQIRRDRQAG